MTNPTTLPEDLWRTLLCDPVLAARLVLGLHLDTFQCARLRYYWWVPNCMDESGFSSGKTIVDWAFVCLRAILLPDQVIGIYYPTGDQGRQVIWPRFTDCRAELYRQQVGKLDEEGDITEKKRSQASSCYTAWFRSGSKVMLPTPNFVKNSFSNAGFRFNTLLCEEWTHADAMSDGINEQLVGRNSRESLNQDHPLWMNHYLFTATAKPRSHPSYARYREYEREVQSGNPHYAILRYSYKDYSNLPSPSGKTFAEEYRNEVAVEQVRKGKDPAYILGELFGVRAATGRGWFGEEDIAGCIARGTAAGLVPAAHARSDI